MNIAQIAHLLTAVLIVLKLMALINIGWLLVLLPSLIMFAIGLLCVIVGGLLVWIGNKL